MSLLGRIAEVFASPDVRARAALLRGPRVAIADAREGQLVRVAGRIAASDGSMKAPFSGRDVVWFSARFEVLHGSEKWVDGRASQGSRESEWVARLTLGDGCAFAIDDDSGKTARIERGARVIVPERLVDASFIERSPDALDALLREHGRPAGDLALVDGKRFYESTLSVGDRVVVQGVARNAPGAPLPARYRSEPSTILVLDEAIATELQR